MMKKNIGMKLGLLAIFVFSVILIAAVQVSLKYARFDLTRGQLYSLSDGTIRTLENLEKPVDLYFFFSEQTTKNIPSVRNYAKRVQELLQEYELRSKGKIKLHIIDPEPFSEAEDQAAEFGLQAVPVSLGGDTVYFGLAGKAENGEQKVVSFFQEDKEKFLEYDLSQLVYRLSTPKKQVIGLLSELPLQGGFDMAARQPQQPWMIMGQIENQFEVKPLSADVAEIPKDIDLLMLVHPKSLSEQTLYAIDQYMLGGGKALIFVDPSAEMDQAGAMMGDGAKASGLVKLFDAWGIVLEKDKVIADWAQAIKVTMQQGSLPQRHLGFLSLRKSHVQADSILTNQLEMINLGTAGSLKVKEGSQTAFEPLLFSSHEAMLLEAAKFNMLMDPAVLLKDFKATGEKYVAAARVQGVVSSAYPEGRPDPNAAPVTPPDAVSPAMDAPSENPGSEVDAGHEHGHDHSDHKDKDAFLNQKPPIHWAQRFVQFFVGSAWAESHEKSVIPVENGVAGQNESSQKAPEESQHLTQSKAPINVIVVADTDLLSDRLWVRIQDFFGQKVAVPWSNNGDFVINALDMLSGSGDLIGLRSRGEYAREFDRVKELQDQAELQFRDKEQVLKKQLEETEAKLSEIQKPSEEGKPLQLSQEQEDALKQFMDEKLKIRKGLREVQHQLDKDIRQLGMTLKVLNVLISPVLLTILLWLAIRQYRKKRLARCI